MAASLACDLDKNDVAVGENIILTGEITGSGNRIEIEGTRAPTMLALSIHGYNNHVRIGPGGLFNGLRIEMGSKRWLASETSLNIGEKFSIASKGRFLLPNSGNRIEIGERCMFSN